jgi:hypothetical protein
MKIFKKDGNRQPTKLQKRIAGISTPELIIYVETLLPTIGRNVVHHGRDGLAALEEAEIAATTAVEIINELKSRIR